MLTSQLDTLIALVQFWMLEVRNSLVGKVVSWFGWNVGPRERSLGAIVRLNQLRTVRG
jgi:hypothetical protein